MGRLEAQTLASRRGPCAPPLPPPESRPPADASRRRLPRRHPDRRRGRGESDGSRNLGVVRERKGVQKNVGIATLGNLCVDVVLDVPRLPPASTAEHRAYMERWRLLLRIRNFGKLVVTAT
ncbi:uncharacterized protein LOC103988201 [Musa acuminata AAA Group]|uniref:uncharacterized protein LOC103988201 n=1 Tax=Musa acuminata AAA Group TaxID=214697 RepID=UPI0031D6F910